jgi:MoaA/NifB/PqqE/SkfB family radical SAM enzyme
VLTNLIALKRLGVRIIDFTGGEPLLHPELSQFLRWAQNLGFRTTVTSNGLLYPRRAHGLKGLIDLLHFSLDAAEPELHNRIRGVDCYDAVIASIDLACSLGERPDVLFTATPETIDQLEAVYRTISMPRGLTLIINPVFEYHEKGNQFTDAQLLHLRAWGSKPRIYLNDAFIELRLRGGNHVKRPVCHAASTTIVISPDNQLIVPCYHAETKTFPIQNQLYKVWKSEEVQTWVKMEGRLPICQGCSINCYFQPSFATHVNMYFWRALPSTSSYIWNRWVAQAYR